MGYDDPSMIEKTDLTNCDREPIHIPGSIQPHGAMLVLDAESFTLRYASANACTILGVAGIEPAMTLEDIVGRDVAHDIRNAFAKAGGSEVPGILLGAILPGLSDPLDVTMHRHQDFTFVEFERAAESGASAEGALDITQMLVRKIGLHTDVGQIAATGARLVRSMLGYDRVMVYQFLHNGAGRVIAEAKNSFLCSFLGQHFPASDIPYQARRLYLRNTIRMIGDSAYRTVPLIPALRSGDKPVDMSFAQLRSVSPIHCEYLQNMGVHASLSISIIVDGELWGLISCHHDSTKVVPLPLRIGAELFGQYFSLQIAVAERRAEILASNLAREQLDKVMGALGADGSLSTKLRENLGALASLIQSDGAAIWVDGKWTAMGLAPPAASVPALIDHIREKAKGSLWHTQELRADLNVEHYGTAVAGALAIPLSASPRDYLLLFRSEEAHNIEWAGAPFKTVVSTPEGERLSPRGSFTTWREDVRGRSQPWTDPELAIAEAIRNYVRDVVLRHSEINEEERARAEKRRRVINAELNHRVKNIIALVKSIALQTGAHATSVADYSASLEGRLRALAFAHDQSLGSSTGDLGTLVEAEASLYRYGGTPDRVVVSGPGIRLDDRSFGVLALVVHELMTNAAKYGALSVSTGKLVIGWRRDAAGDCEISWIELGGPTLAAPKHEGFGSKLIRTTVAHDLGGTVTIDYAPEGLRAKLTVPAARISSAEPVAVRSPAAESSATSLDGLSVLIVEDQALIALDIEEMIRKLGAREIRLSPNVDDAQKAIERFGADIAVLDFNLGAETSEAIADQLISEGIPFVFSTGYGDSLMIPERFRQVPVVRKPVNESALAAQLGVAQSILH